MGSDVRVLELSVLAGEILLHNGAEIFRVEETMHRISSHFNVNNFNVYAISNAIFASVTENGEVHSTQIRQIPLSSVHLGRVAAVNQLSRDIEEGKFTIDEAYEQLKKIKEIPYTKNLYRILAYGLGSACFCYIFGGNILDSITAFISGALPYLFVIFASKKGLSKIITNILASSIITLCSILLFSIGIGNNLDKIIIGSIVLLLPGVLITTAIRDYLNSDYLSGTIKLIDAFLVAFCIAVGVGFVYTAWSFITGVVL